MAMVTATAMAMAMGTDRAGALSAHQTLDPIVLQRSVAWQRRRARACVACIALALATACAQAQTVRFSGSIGVLETLTDNVNLAPAGAEKSDLVSQITPSVSFDVKSAHAYLRGNVAFPILIYARTSENNTAYVSGDIVGSLEVIDRFFFIEAAAIASQQYVTPFGQTPQGLTNATDNRYTSVTYRVSPYIQGVTAGNIDYLLRMNAVWGNLNGAPLGLNSSNYTEWIGRLASPVAPYGWAIDFNRTEVDFENQSPQIMQLARLRLIKEIDPQLQVSGSVGYEDNQFPLSDYRDVIYGIQGRWRPTERTDVVANWEHRFFGASYLVAFDHRTPASVWSLHASRNITTYTQQLGSLPAGGNVPLLLNDLLTTRIPDPALRQAAVNQLIADRGLPTVLTGPVNLYTQQVLLQEAANASIGLLGINNAVFLNAYYLKTQPITGSGATVPPDLSFGNNTTQRGVDLTWTHALTPFMNFAASTGASRTDNNGGIAVQTESFYVRAGVNWKLSPLTSVTAGARYQLGRSDFELTDYREKAVFAGFLHTFR